MISKKMLIEYKRIYKKDFGKDISDKEALEQGANLVNLVELILDMMYENKKGTGVKKQPK